MSYVVRAPNVYLFFKILVVYQYSCMAHRMVHRDLAYLFSQTFGWKVTYRAP